MCVVVPHILARGPLRAPVQPPAVALVRALNPARASRPYRRSTTRRAWRRPSPPAPNHGSMGVSPPLETHSQGRCRSPLHPIDPFRRTEGAVAPPRNPATKEPSAPFGNLDQPSADWMPIRSLVTRYPRPFHGDQTLAFGGDQRACPCSLETWANLPPVGYTLASRRWTTTT